jgi:hypothetical protein
MALEKAMLGSGNIIGQFIILGEQSFELRCLCDIGNISVPWRSD